MTRRRETLVLGLAISLWLLAACQLPEPLPAPPRDSGALSLFVQPEGGEAHVLEAIDGARESIRLKMYLLTNQRAAACRYA